MLNVDPKQKALEDFFRTLKISLGYITAYSSTHRAFLESLPALKKSIEELFGFTDYLKIGFSADSVFFGEAEYSKLQIFQDMAKFFHFIKIKSIEVKKSIDSGELAIILDKLSLPAKEIRKLGGWSSILKETKVFNFLVEELDYLQFLRGSEEEVKDIWSYLLKDALDKDLIEKIKQCVDNFAEIMKKIRVSDFIWDADLNKNLIRFFDYLKSKDKNGLMHCAKSMFRIIIKDKGSYSPQEIDKLKIFLAELNIDDFAQAFWDEISTDDKFDNRSFDLFLNLIDKDKHEKIAASLKSDPEKMNMLKSNIRMNRKFNELFEETEDSLEAQVYGFALAGFIQKDFNLEGITFDQNHLEGNYHIILLYFLNQETSADTIDSISKKLLKDLNYITKEWLNEPHFFVIALDTLIRLRKEFPESIPVEELYKKLANFVESIFLEGNAPDAMGPVSDLLQKSVLDFETYIKKIFKENKFSFYILKFMIRFFPDKLSIFYDMLKDKSSDVDFIMKIIVSLKASHNPLGVQTLELIYSFSNDLIKLEVLKALNEVGELDKNFILSIVGKESFLLKKEALSVLSKDPEAVKEASKSLLLLPSPWGKKNNYIIENIRLIQELRLKETKEDLQILSKRPFFWNSKMRAKAREALDSIP